MGILLGRKEAGEMSPDPGPESQIGQSNKNVVEDFTFNSIPTPEDQQNMTGTNKVNDFVGGVLDNLTEAFTGEKTDDR
jgi:hypothetical protein